MRINRYRIPTLTAALLGMVIGAAACDSDPNQSDTSAGGEVPPEGEQPEPPPAPLPGESFDDLMNRLAADKAGVMAEQLSLLEGRYDLSDNATELTMTRGKPIQTGVRVRLVEGISWEELATLAPEEIRTRGIFPEGFRPLPHVKHEEGGMVFPLSSIEEIRAQTARDLERFDVDFDFPEHLLPEFPPAIFLTTRPELGDVSQGEVVTTQNFFRLFNGILNPKQLDGFRLLVFPFPQQQFNLTDDRRSAEPQLGVACFDCHINGHSNGAFHLVGDIRPQEERNRIDTTSLRGVRIQQLFGSQRALQTVEDFTEFEQRSAYFDGDIDKAARKGMNPLERGSEVHHMAELQRLLDFPPAPKLDAFGFLNGSATEAEVRGEALFMGKARCGECHPPPDFLDHSMHDLQIDRFFEPRLVNNHSENGDGPIKTFTLRGIKESPPYLHDGRLLTLEDTIEFFNLVLALELTADEKADLLAYLLVL